MGNAEIERCSKRTHSDWLQVDITRGDLGNRYGSSGHRGLVVVGTHLEGCAEYAELDERHDDREGRRRRWREMAAIRIAQITLLPAASVNFDKQCV